MSLEDETPAWAIAGSDERFQQADRVVEVAAAVDADGLLEPAWLGFREGRLLGPAASPPSVPADRVERRPDLLAMPAMINPHVHLDLTTVGPVTLREGFDGWLETIRARRPRTEGEIRASVDAGIAASLRGGVVGVGDILGAAPEAAVETLASADLASVAFVECLGIGRRESAGLAMVDRVCDTLPLRRGRVEVGLSPHAPYSCSRGVYEAAVASGRPVSSHLAESLEELEFCREGRGPMVDLLRRVGALGEEEGIDAAGRHPVLGLPATPSRPWVLAHVNLLGTEEEEEAVCTWLRRHHATVVYCPRAAAMLGHLDRAGSAHPWRRLLDRGVRVAVGTDGMPCLDRADRISPLDELPRLMGGAEDLPRLVGLVTVAGAIALGWNADAVRFRGGCEAGVLGVAVGDGPPLEGLRRHAGPIEWLLGPNPDALRRDV